MSDIPPKEFAADDPMELVGVVLPAKMETMQEMAYAITEEFVLLGYDNGALLRMFQNPFYAGAHQAYRTLGEEAIRKIVDECLAAWGGVRFAISDFCENENPKPVLRETEGSKIQNGGRKD